VRTGDRLRSIDKSQEITFGVGHGCAGADLPLRYHYGFDLLSASLTAVLRLPVDRAIDAATLGL